MDCRFFTGTILGTIPSLALPFETHEARLKSCTKLERIKRCIRIFEIAECRLKQFHCGIILQNSEVIEVTHLESATRNLETLFVLFKWQKIILNQAVSVKDLILLDDEGFKIRERHMEPAIYVTPKDSLHLSYAIDCSF